MGAGGVFNSIMPFTSAIRRLQAPAPQTTKQETSILDADPYVLASTPFVKQETATVEPIVKEEIPQQPTNLLTEKDAKVLTTDGTNDEKLLASTHYLQEKYGFSKAGASGFLACLNASSHLRLNAENKQEKNGENPHVKASQHGFGIIQWTGDRADRARAHFNKMGRKDLQTQLDYGMSEMPEDLKHILQTIENPEDAAAYTWACFMAERNRASSFNTLDELYKKIDQIVTKKANTYHGMGYGYTNG